jgi:YD repeat-containing protein
MKNFDGSVYQFGYTGNFLSSITYPSGNAWNYTYDPSSGVMLTKTDLAGYQTS